LNDKDIFLKIAKMRELNKEINQSGWKKYFSSPSMIFSINKNKKEKPISTFVFDYFFLII